MNSFDRVTHKIVKVYFRNQQKMAKIVLLPELVQANELYQTASLSYNIPINGIHLFYGGKMVVADTQVTLTDNSIIHVVNLLHLNTEELVLIVKMIEGNGTTVTLRTNRNTHIQEFIDNKLSTVLGLKSDRIFLVHMGRQLSLQKTFKEEEVQTNCQLLCLNFQQENSYVSNQAPQNQITNDGNYLVSVSMKQDLRNEENHKASKDIYPTPNFTIQVPEEMEIESTFNHLNLIFDSKVRRSSSIRGIDFMPDQIIAQEEDVSLIEKHSYKSEISEKLNQKSNISHYSEHRNESLNDLLGSNQKSHTKLSRHQEAKKKGQNVEIFTKDDFLDKNSAQKQYDENNHKTERRVSGKDGLNFEKFND